MLDRPTESDLCAEDGLPNRVDLSRRQRRCKNDFKNYVTLPRERNPEKE